jgi:hypothetical protein
MLERRARALFRIGSASGDTVRKEDVMTLETATTEYLPVGDARFAFRRLGPANGTPLILLQHFTGTIDGWDPAVVNGLAATRPVIAFDNLGVAVRPAGLPIRSNGWRRMPRPSSGGLGSQRSIFSFSRSAA